jgi:hypothetical protein
MARIEETGGYCRRCEKYVLLRGKPVHHIRYLLFTILTLGVGIIPWLATMLASQPWRCTVCGSVFVDFAE